MDPIITREEDLHGYFALFAQEPYIYQVIGLVPEKEFPTIRYELKQTVSSFELERPKGAVTGGVAIGAASDASRIGGGEGGGRHA